MNDAEKRSAHELFSAECFNEVWDLLDLEGRSDDDTERMIHLAHASFWHWLERPDATPQNTAVGYWQLARVYAAAGAPGRAVHYGNKCLEVSSVGSIDPFFSAYAHEAIARAELIRSHVDDAKQHLDAARALMPTSAESDLSKLRSDLDEIESML